MPLPKQITERDVQILCDLARYRYLTTTQAARLRFPSNQTASRRLRVLEQSGYLNRFRAIAVPGHGSNDFIHHLTRAGAELVAYQINSSVDSIRYSKRNRKIKHGWRMDHTLAIVEFWISLDLATMTAGCTLQRFIPEWEGSADAGRFTSTLKTTVPHPLKPSQSLTLISDAAFVLERFGKSALFFLEVDRATETVESSKYPDFTDRLLSYVSLRKHEEHRRLGGFRGFRVLVTTVNQGRLESYQKAAQGLGVEKLFLFALFDRITPEEVLAPVWCTSDPGAQPVALIRRSALNRRQQGIGLVTPDNSE